PCLSSAGSPVAPSSTAQRASTRSPAAKVCFATWVSTTRPGPELWLSLQPAASTRTRPSTHAWFVERIASPRVGGFLNCDDTLNTSQLEGLATLPDRQL